MELYEGNLYCPSTGKSKEFKNLRKDKECDITIIGGGMSGILCSYYLSLEGYEVVLIEKDKIGEGSSSANTGLLQYSSDIMLHKLAQNIGEEEGFLFYKMCYEAMEDFRNLPNNIKEFAEFYTRDSIYIASNENDLKDLKNEFTMLKKYNFPMDFVDRDRLLSIYGILGFGAIISHGDADDKRVFYCLGFGGNGTVYSISGAKIIVDLLNNNQNPYAHIVKIKR